jgi:hypothetical protein
MMVLSRPTFSPCYILVGYSIILIDASWEVSGKAGGGAISYDPTGKIGEVGFFSYIAGDATHMKAVALSQTVQSFLAKRTVQKGVFVTYC